jgi:hypothetical protein
MMMTQKGTAFHLTELPIHLREKVSGALRLCPTRGPF